MRRCRGFISNSAQLARETESSIQEKIDFEMRMREGICKLLAVSTQKDQTLHAVKNLMVCNARILAYRKELQRETGDSVVNRTNGRCSDFAAKEREACRGKIAISDLRIPLMWKGSDHFSSKDSMIGTQRYSVFCLLKIGPEVFDTDLLIVDKAITDICFEGVTVFEQAGPDFQLKVEVYSCCCTEESLAIANTPKKLVKKLKTSIGKATGKKLSSAVDNSDLEALLFTDTVELGAKYSLLAHTTLGLESVEDSFKTHSLTVVGNEEASFWLPLYGSMCCRLIAQPSCMTNDMMTGFLNQQQTLGDLASWRNLYCVLRGGTLLCYNSPEERATEVEPTLIVSVNKETRIHAVDKNTQKKMVNFSVINPEGGEAVTQVFAFESREDLYKWMEAFWQHFYDFSQWRHCCDEFMKIEVMSPRKPPLFLTKEATSVYQDMSIDSPMKCEGLMYAAQQKMEETNGECQTSQQEENVPSLWAAMFNGSCPMLVQKSMLPDAVPGEGKGKKRRAPLPPSDKPPFISRAQTPTDEQGKENSPSQNCSDSILSSVPHLQRPVAAPRKPGSCQKGTIVNNRSLVPPATKSACSEKPVPAPRQTSVHVWLDPRACLHSQV
ncbi:hypothetical protein lerEdw1_013794 [Lerista edwardsae]|nr:hypothetical protein lerEdw1_013794 [Lerista edwardsae]